MSEPAPNWRNRIIGHGDEDPEQLLGNPLNARVHPLAQVKATTALLDEVGWVAEVIVNQRTGFLVDGHLRVAEAISRGERSVPVTYVDLSDDEERLILAFYDGTGAMAAVNPAQYLELVQGLDVPQGLQSLADALGAGNDPSAPDPSDDDLPPSDNELSWGYLTFGKTKVGASVAEVDTIHGLWEQYKSDNDGDDTGFAAWLARTDR